MNNGYIKLDRKILKWEWYKNINTKIVFIHLLLKANWEEGRFEGEVIPRGSLVASINHIAFEIGLTDNEVRRAIKHLKLTNEITSKGTSRFTVFTIKNYNKYQSINERDDEQLTSESQTINERLTTIEEVKKLRIKELKNKEIGVPAHPRKQAFHPPTVDEVRMYCAERGNSVDEERFVDFYETKGWMVGKNKMKDWKAAVRTWEKQDAERGASSKSATKSYDDDGDFFGR